MGTLILRLLIGMLGGILAWMIWEPAYPKDVSVTSQVELYMVLTAGALIGAGVGGFSGYLRGGKRHTLTGLVLGLVFGAIGISFGYSVGGGLSRALFGPVWWNSAATPFPVQVMGRMVALTPIGLFLGIAVGASTLNVRRTVQGAIGGVLAGAASGATFDLLGNAVGTAFLAMRGQASGETGSLSRALTWVLIGGLIGLFIGIVERVTRSAWIRLSLGRNKGKEWAIDRDQTFLGRSEAATIPLFGDPTVAPLHAVIFRQGQQYMLVDNNSGMGTFLNGMPIQQAPLMPGSQIRIGNTTLEFLTKNVAVAPGGPETRPIAYPVGGQTPPPGASPPYGQPAPAPPYGAPTQAMPPMGPGMPTQAMPPAPSAPTMAFAPPTGVPVLTALDGPLAGQRFPVAAMIEVGRDLPTIPMAGDAAASRRHASLAPAPGGLQVMDLGSTNGTYVNGARVPSGMVPFGGTVRIGSTTFRVDPA